MATSSFDFSSLPVVVGVTGHRDIPKESAAALEGLTAARLLAVQKQWRHSPVIVLSSLAEGADRICARAALRTGCELCAALPMEPEEYEEDFGEASRAEFRELLSQAANVYVTNGADGSGCADEKPKVADGSGCADEESAGAGEDTPRGHYYRQAGLFIAKRAHMLLALWDGKETLYAEGGGTYETICFARREKINVCHIQTPRAGNADASGYGVGGSDASGYGAGGSDANAPISALPEDTRVDAIDAFNRDALKRKARLEKAAAKNKEHFADAQIEETLGGEPRLILNALLLADALSVIYRNLKLLTLRILSLLGLLLVLSFLLYDEMESNLMLFVYGAVIIGAGALYALSSKRGVHGKYVAYRALTEALRVQFYWTLCGIAEQAYGSYSYTQKEELDFVRFFFRALRYHPCEQYISSERTRESVRKRWIQGQLDYHRASAIRKGKQAGRNNAAARWALFASILLFVAVAVMEAFFSADAERALLIAPELRRFLLMHGDQQLIWRGALKLALGLVSAGTAFLANYYGGLALPQQIFDNKRMAALFGGEPLSQDDEAITDEFLLTLGRESMLESGGWYIAQKENAPALFIG